MSNATAAGSSGPGGSAILGGGRQPAITTDVDHAVAVLRAGGLVGIPTETVYGLAADATNADAVRRIFAVKQRPADHPLIVHIAGAGLLPGWCSTVPESATRLAAACWPGPLTLLVPRAAHVLTEVTGGRDTIGLRVPAHPLTLRLLHHFGGALAAPSANLYGRVSPTTPRHVQHDLGGLLELVLDGGPSDVGVESTIVDCTVDPPQVLRPGAITSEQIGAILDSAVAAGQGPSRAPGMLAAHYAPRCTVMLVGTLAEAAVVAAAEGTEGRHVDILDLGPDLASAARTLYADLRDADDRDVDVLVAVLPSPGGLGDALRDRLTKAAAGSTGAAARLTRADRPEPGTEGPPAVRGG